MAEAKHSWLLVAVDRLRQIYVLDADQSFFFDNIISVGQDEEELIQLPHEHVAPGCYLIQGITLMLIDLEGDAVRDLQYDVIEIHGSWSMVSRPNFPEEL